jgi:signal transduction histidine kinase
MIYLWINSDYFYDPRASEFVLLYPTFLASYRSEPIITPIPYLAGAALASLVIFFYLTKRFGLGWSNMFEMWAFLAYNTCRTVIVINSEFDLVLGMVGVIFTSVALYPCFGHNNVLDNMRIVVSSTFNLALLFSTLSFSFLHVIGILVFSYRMATLRWGHLAENVD